MQNEISKMVVSLAALLIGSWTLFGVIINRWVKRTDDDIKELYKRAEENCRTGIAINAEIKSMMRIIEGLEKNGKQN